MFGENSEFLKMVYNFSKAIKAFLYQTYIAFSTSITASVVSLVAVDMIWSALSI